MSKAYLLVICLLAVSFTGCMSGSDDDTELPSLVDDETKQEDDTKEEETEQEEEEEELIDPVGQEPLEDTSKDCNCTVIVEDESYDPEYFSSVWISNQPLGYWNETGVFIEYSDVNEYGGSAVFRGFFNKTGNNLLITPLPYTNDSFAPFTLDDMGRGNSFWYQITIYGPDGLVWQDYVKFLYYDCQHWSESGQYCYMQEDGGMSYPNEYFFNTVDIVLPWEPLGFSLRYTNNYDEGTPGDAQVTRSF